VTRVAEIDAQAELHLYGSVTTGQAIIGRSDVDLISIGLPDEAARAAGRHRPGSLLPSRPPSPT
jgi:hypothetical protein